ncbi:MAG: Cytidine deaminase, partial [uncultured Nocardioides sp.]
GRSERRHRRLGGPAGRRDRRRCARLRAVQRLPRRSRSPRQGGRRQHPRGRRLQRRERVVRRGPVRRVRPGQRAARVRRRPADALRLRQRSRRGDHAVRPVPAAAPRARRPGPRALDRLRHAHDGRGPPRRLRRRLPGRNAHV